MKLRIIVLLFLTTAVSSLASAQQIYQFKGKDITPVVDWMKSSVKVLSQEIYIYNWSANAHTGDSNLLSSSRAASDGYWQAYGHPKGVENMYGSGLYAALDPVVTYGYGGGAGKWRLLEMRLPVGLRVLDIPELNSIFNVIDDPKQGAYSVLESFQCPFQSSSVPTLFSVIDEMLKNGGAQKPQACVDLIKEVFRNILKIDAFAYNYSASNFRGCKGGWSMSKAFVITSSRWMTNANVIYFTSKSTKNFEDRVRIQTLFLERPSATFFGAAPNAEVTAATNALADFLERHPDFDFQKAWSSCIGESCELIARFCKTEDTCKEELLLRYPRQGGGFLTAKAAAQTVVGGLLWPDLEGVPKAPRISKWLFDKMYACSGELPYSSSIEAGGSN